MRPLHNKEVLCILPAHNEAEALSVLLPKINRYGFPALVVDDGSCDGTGDVSRKYNAEVIRLPVNSGKGIALRKGFVYLLESDYQAAITLDADGQHSPSAIEDFLDIQRCTCADMIIGNRMLRKQAMPRLRLFTNKLMSWMLSVMLRQRLYDTQCGFRLISRNILARCVLYESGYALDSELLVAAVKNGYKVVQAPIETIYLGSKSQIRPMRDTLYFLRAYLRFLLRRY